MRVADEQRPKILQLIWSGLVNREIASCLKISVKTVESHRATMMRKVRVTNTAQLIKTRNSRRPSFR
jgi:DNA-binding NarL/FixJ family response regulator